MGLKEELNSKGLDYWDFKNIKSAGIHKISAYPATMVPDMQYELINIILHERKNIENILDPFHGSGVTLVEGAKSGLVPMGIDINPLANLITRVKLQGVSKKQIKISNRRVEYRLKKNMNFNMHKFYNINKWYRTDFIVTFSKIRAAIQKEEYKHIRQYYWVCLINILKKYSNTRSSTFKLHIKSDKDISAMMNDIETDFLKNINTYFKFLPDYTKSKKINLKIGKSEEVLLQYPDNSVDLICTSPPYGDNATTVTYGQYSMLPLYWIDKNDIDNFDLKLIDNYSSIDSNSLGGRLQRHFKTIDSVILDNYLKSIDVHKRKKVIAFIYDYFNVMEQLVRVLKKDRYIILTLGNRRIDNKILPLTEITKEYFESNDFELEASITRNIPMKRMPEKLSSVRKKAVKSMKKEYILILRKK